MLSPTASEGGEKAFPRFFLTNRDPMHFSRRGFIRTLGAAAITSLNPRARADHAAAGAATATLSCGADTAPSLLIPRDRGFLGRLPLDERPLSLRAAPMPAGAALPQGLTQAYFASVDGRDFVNPTLVLRRGQRV